MKEFLLIAILLAILVIIVWQGRRDAQELRAKIPPLKVMAQSFRTVEVRRGGRKWEQIEFADLEAGEWFRLKEPTGEYVRSPQGGIGFKALERPVEAGKNGNWSILVVRG